MTIDLNRYFVVILFLGTSSVFGYDLKVEYVKAKLPAPMADSTPFYDGNDRIYLFGGRSASHSQTVYKLLEYSISEDSVEEVAELPSACSRGSVQAIGTDIYFFGGYTSGGALHTDVVKFDTVTKSATSVARLPRSAMYHTSFKQVNSSVVYFLLSMDRKEDPTRLYECDLSTGSYTFTHIEDFYGITAHTSVIYGNQAYLYGQGSGESRDDSQIQVVDMTSLKTRSLFFSRRYFSISSTAVSDGEFTYIVDSLDANSESGYLPNPFVKFNGMSHIAEYPEVKDFPVYGDLHYMFAPSGVYVEKLNRIYYFGGRTQNRTSMDYADQDDIWFIDLTPTEIPTSTVVNPTFSCEDRPDGMYPHPSDCSKFVGCQDGVYSEFVCPPPLLFDPVNRRCDRPGIVECQLTCFGKPDGQYPHPSDCSMFLLCENEDLAVYQCPPPLLFDPVVDSCNFPDAVDCTAKTSW